MSFWAEQSLPVSQIEHIMQQQGFTLEQLLDEDEIIQEVKHENAKLIPFLQQPETLNKLIRYIVEPASDEASAQRKFKFPYVCSEIVACEVPSLLALLSEPVWMTKMCSILDQPDLRHLSNTGFWGKAMQVLLEKCHQQVADYFCQNDVARKLVDHIGSYSVLDLLCKLWFEFPDAPQLVSAQWLSEAKLVSRLVGKLDLEYEFQSDIQSNAAAGLINIIQVSPAGRVSPLIVQLLEQQQLSRLLNNMFNSPPSSSSARNSLLVLTALVNRNTSLTAFKSPATSVADDKKAAAQSAALASTLDPADVDYFNAHVESTSATPENSSNNSSNNSSSNGVTPPASASSVEGAPPASSSSSPAPPAAAPAPAPAAPAPAAASAAGSLITPCEIPEVLDMLASHIDKFLGLFAQAPESDHKIVTQTNQTLLPLGETRLKAVELLMNVLHLEHKGMFDIVAERHLLSVVLDLFFAFEWNNLLHSHVFKIVQAVMSSNSVPLQTQLFGHAKLVDRIKQPRGVRLGYMAYVMKIANLIVEHKDKAHLSEFLQDPKWQEFVDGPLIQWNNDVSKPVGGNVPNRVDIAASVAGQPDLLSLFSNLAGGSIPSEAVLSLFAQMMGASPADLQNFPFPLGLLTGAAGAGDDGDGSHNPFEQAHRGYSHDDDDDEDDTVVTDHSAAGGEGSSSANNGGAGTAGSKTSARDFFSAGGDEEDGGDGEHHSSDDDDDDENDVETQLAKLARAAPGGPDEDDDEWAAATSASSTSMMSRVIAAAAASNAASVAASSRANSNSNSNTNSNSNSNSKTSTSSPAASLASVADDEDWANFDDMRSTAKPVVAASAAAASASAASSAASSASSAASSTLPAASAATDDDFDNFVSSPPVAAPPASSSSSSSTAASTTSSASVVGVVDPFADAMKPTRPK